jgi:uncharacterized protein YggU (UPF0235/DUF167 family)
MIIEVKVVTRAKVEKVEMRPNGSLKVWVRSAPERGKANARVVELLAEYYHKPKKCFLITQGKKSAHKIIFVDSANSSQP